MPNAVETHVHNMQKTRGAVKLAPAHGGGSRASAPSHPKPHSSTSRSTHTCEFCIQGTWHVAARTCPRRLGPARPPPATPCPSAAPAALGPPPPPPGGAGRPAAAPAWSAAAARRSAVSVITHTARAQHTCSYAMGMAPIVVSELGGSVHDHQRGHQADEQHLLGELPVNQQRYSWHVRGIGRAEQWNTRPAPDL